TNGLSQRCEPMRVEPRDGKLWGFTKVAFSERPEGDFCLVIETLQKLARRLRRLTFVASDDLRLVDPSEVSRLGDPKTIIDPGDPTGGAGFTQRGRPREAMSIALPPRCR